MCLKLNDEWTLSCVAKNIAFDIEIRRKINCEEISISGALSFRKNDQKASRQTFTKLIESGSSFTKLIDLHTNLQYSSDCLYLHGVVNIISNSEKCTSDFETRGCKIFYQPKSLVQLSDDFERLLDPQTSCFSDVNLKCGSASIPAHKLILSARSPVFAAMFKNPMKETHKNEVDITDIDASVLQAMTTGNTIRDIDASVLQAMTTGNTIREKLLT
ncbi:hypothetical protein AVEN_226398-1 [Araneus ventricosus]|uniref:BTB domain-containing protein n=1 Tax=Araneus ventricosus TaxID=182803 RepID=A0A4Y2IKL3_ARAVE|nr:hypothetical protein AVEN_226398-1 [Araneus ventricosus]